MDGRPRPVFLSSPFLFPLALILNFGTQYQGFCSVREQSKKTEGTFIVYCRQGRRAEQGRNDHTEVAHIWRQMVRSSALFSVTSRVTLDRESQ
jgi:hypothetical protein